MVGSQDALGDGQQVGDLGCAARFSKPASRQSPEQRTTAPPKAGLLSIQRSRPGHNDRLNPVAGLPTPLRTLSGLTRGTGKSCCRWVPSVAGQATDIACPPAGLPGLHLSPTLAAPTLRPIPPSPLAPSPGTRRDIAPLRERGCDGTSTSFVRVARADRQRAGGSRERRGRLSRPGHGQQPAPGSAGDPGPHAGVLQRVPAAGDHRRGPRALQRAAQLIRAAPGRPGRRGRARRTRCPDPGARPWPRRPGPGRSGGGAGAAGQPGVEHDVGDIAAGALRPIYIPHTPGTGTDAGGILFPGAA